MTLSKAARHAVENATPQVTGQDMSLPPKTRLSLARIYHGGEDVVVQVKLSDKVFEGAFSRRLRRDIERQTFRLHIVDGEVLLSSRYGSKIWASGWHGHTNPEELSLEREKALIPRAYEMVKEMQELSDSLDRKPPTEEEVRQAQLDRDRKKLNGFNYTLTRASQELVGVEIANLEQVRTAMEVLRDQVQTELQWVVKEMTKEEEEGGE